MGCDVGCAGGCTPQGERSLAVLDPRPPTVVTYAYRWIYSVAYMKKNQWLRVCELRPGGLMVLFAAPPMGTGGARASKAGAGREKVHHTKHRGTAERERGAERSARRRTELHQR